METCICQNTTKGTCERSETEEEGDAILALATLVPHGEIIHDAGKETALCHTQEESSDKKSGQIADDAEQSGDDTPS